MEIARITEKDYCDSYAEMAEANNIAETVSSGSLTIHRGMCPHSGLESILIHDAMSGSYLSIVATDPIDAYSAGMDDFGAEVARKLSELKTDLDLPDVPADEEPAPFTEVTGDELADLIGSLACEPTVPSLTVEEIKDIDDNIQRLRNDMTRLWERVMALEAMRKAA